MKQNHKAAFAAFIVLELVAIVFVLLVAAPLHSEDYLSEDASGAIKPPDPKKLDVVAMTTVQNGNQLRAIVMYDDPATSRPVDYIAMYSPAGELLALSWYDRFGIERMAVDRGLLDNADHPEGTFVAFLTGAAL
jgi:hypothetical protein